MFLVAFSYDFSLTIEQFQMHKLCSSIVIVFAMTFYLDLRVLESFGILCVLLLLAITQTMHTAAPYECGPFIILKLYNNI